MPDDLAQAASVFLAMHDFELAETYFDKAKLVGANQRTVGIGPANTYLAEGDTAKLGKRWPRARRMISAKTMTTRWRRRIYTASAVIRCMLTAFAQVSTVAGPEDQRTAQFAQNDAANREGHQITPNLSLSPEVTFAPSLEDINVYTLDARILHVTNPLLLPPPRRSYQSEADSHYRIHLGNLPAITGFVGESLTAGRFLFFPAST